MKITLTHMQQLALAQQFAHAIHTEVVRRVRLFCAA
jgi:hypothetical protein